MRFLHGLVFLKVFVAPVFFHVRVKYEKYIVAENKIRIIEVPRKAAAGSSMSIFTQRRLIHLNLYPIVSCVGAFAVTPLWLYFQA